MAYGAVSQDLGDGVFLVDTGYHRPGLAACYVIIENGRAAVIDAGVGHSVPRILEVLAAQGLTPAEVDYIVPTHVHLDHAGGAGGLMQACPQAQMVVHPRGARHMIDPARLIAGAEVVYGREGLRRSVGEILPVDADRVHAAEDGYRFNLEGRELTIVDTPGHARHHFCVWDDRTHGFFTGDTFGLAYPELSCAGEPFLIPPTTPVQFEPEAWHRSIDRLMAWRPERVYLTHFGLLEDPARYSADLHRRIDDLAGLARQCGRGGSALLLSVKAYLDSELGDAGCRLDERTRTELLDLDIGLIVQGLEVWLSRQTG
jgi:glyoxylase-like metal-dependent hydrolase (beta-lactamase superfamily II)